MNEAFCTSDKLSRFDYRPLVTGVRDKFLRDLQIGVFWEPVSFCATTWLHPAAQGCKATLGR